MHLRSKLISYPLLAGIILNSFTGLAVGSSHPLEFDVQEASFQPKMKNHFHESVLKLDHVQNSPGGCNLLSSSKGASSTLLQEPYNSFLTMEFCEGVRLKELQAQEEFSYVLPYFSSGLYRGLTVSPLLMKMLERTNYRPNLFIKAALLPALTHFIGKSIENLTGACFYIPVNTVACNIPGLAHYCKTHTAINEIKTALSSYLEVIETAKGYLRDSLWGTVEGARFLSELPLLLNATEAFSESSASNLVLSAVACSLPHDSQEDLKASKDLFKMLTSCYQGLFDEQGFSPHSVLACFELYEQATKLIEAKEFLSITVISNILASFEQESNCHEIQRVKHHLSRAYDALKSDVEILSSIIHKVKSAAYDLKEAKILSRLAEQDFPGSEEIFFKFKLANKNMRQGVTKIWDLVNKARSIVSGAFKGLHHLIESFSSLTLDTTLEYSNYIVEDTNKDVRVIIKSVELEKENVIESLRYLLEAGESYLWTVDYIAGGSSTAYYSAKEALMGEEAFPSLYSWALDLLKKEKNKIVYSLSPILGSDASSLLDHALHLAANTGACLFPSDINLDRARGVFDGATACYQAVFDSEKSSFFPPSCYSFYKNSLAFAETGHWETLILYLVKTALGQVPTPYNCHEFHRLNHQFSNTYHTFKDSLYKLNLPLVKAQELINKYKVFWNSPSFIETFIQGTDKTFHNLMKKSISHTLERRYNFNKITADVLGAASIDTAASNFLHPLKALRQWHKGIPKGINKEVAKKASEGLIRYSLEKFSPFEGFAASQAAKKIYKETFLDESDG